MYLLHGYLGYANYGDELLAALVQDQLRKLDPSSKIERLSSRNNLIEHLKLISSCSEMICIGGLFQDKTSDRSPIYYCATIILARLLGKRVKILAQGIGPLHQTKSKFFTWLAYRLANKVSVRDATSKEMLSRWGIRHYYGSDLAWLLVNTDAVISDKRKTEIANIFFNIDLIPQGSIAANLSNQLGDSVTVKQPMGNSIPTMRAKQPLLVISLRSEAGDFSGKLSERIIDKIAREFCIDTETQLMILQMQDQDRKVHDMFYNYTKKIYFIEAKYFKPEELIYILRTYGSEMIGMRFHALVFAKIAGLEITAIASDPKIREFTEQIETYDTATLKERAAEHYRAVL